MSKDFSHKCRDAIAEDAASYLVELEEPRPDTKARLAAWLKASPEHVEEFLAVVELWDGLADVGRQPSIDELVALAAGEPVVIELDAVSKDTNRRRTEAPATDEPEPTEVPERAVRTATAGPGRPYRLRARGVRLAAAATLAAIAVAGAIQLLPETPDPNTYTTSIGEQTSLPLPDGSLVTLNTQSTLRVAYSDHFRDIHLTAGEALFDVAKNPERPFRVITEHAVVTAVGTQFNVRNVADDVLVTVVEGVVDVEATRSTDNHAGQVGAASGTVEPRFLEPARVTVGQQARVKSQSGEIAVVDTEVDNATAWKERRLVFESITLAEVIDEFNRYNEPPMLIDDPKLRELPISGVFRANDRASFVQFLDQMHLATSRTQADGTVVLHGTNKP